MGLAKGLIPLNFKTTIYEICLEIDLTLSKFIRGQIIVCCILGICYAVTLSLVGLNYGIFVLKYQNSGIGF